MILSPRTSEPPPHHDRDRSIREPSRLSRVPPRLGLAIAAATLLLGPPAAGAAWRLGPSQPVVWKDSSEGTQIGWAADGDSYYRRDFNAMTGPADLSRLSFSRHDAATNERVDGFSIPNQPVDFLYAVTAGPLTELPDGRIAVHSYGRLWVGRPGAPNDQWDVLPVRLDDNLEDPADLQPPQVRAAQVLDDGQTLQLTYDVWRTIRPRTKPRPPEVRLENPGGARFDLTDLSREDVVFDAPASIQSVSPSGRIAMSQLVNPDGTYASGAGELLDLQTGTRHPLHLRFQRMGLNLLWDDVTAVGRCFSFPQLDQSQLLEFAEQNAGKRLRQPRQIGPMSVGPVLAVARPVRAEGAQQTIAAVSKKETPGLTAAEVVAELEQIERRMLEPVPQSIRTGGKSHGSSSRHPSILPKHGWFFIAIGEHTQHDDDTKTFNFTSRLLHLDGPPLDGSEVDLDEILRADRMTVAAGDYPTNQHEMAAFSPNGRWLLASRKGDEQWENRMIDLSVLLDAIAE